MRQISGATALMACLLVSIADPARAESPAPDTATEKFVWSLISDARPGELNYCRDLPLMGLICHKIRQVQSGSFGLMHMDIGDEPDEKRNFRRQADGMMVDAMAYAPGMHAVLHPTAATGIVKRDKKQYRLTLATETTYQQADRPNSSLEPVRSRTIEWTVPDRNLQRLRQIRDLAQRAGATEIVRRLDFLLD